MYQRFGGKKCYRVRPPNFESLRKWDWSGLRPFPLRERQGAEKGGGHIIGGGVQNRFGGGVLWYVFPSPHRIHWSSRRPSEDFPLGVSRSCCPSSCCPLIFLQWLKGAGRVGRKCFSMLARGTSLCAPHVPYTFDNTDGCEPRDRSSSCIHLSPPPRIVRGLLGTDPPDLTLESASPSPPQGSIRHRFDIDSTSISWFDPISMPNRPLRRGRRVGSKGPVPIKPHTIQEPP